MPALDGRASMSVGRGLNVRGYILCSVALFPATSSILCLDCDSASLPHYWKCWQLGEEKLPSWVRTQLWLTSRPLAPYQLKSGRSAACQILDPQLTAPIWRIARFSVFKSFLVMIVWWHVKKTRREETQESSMITAYYTIPWAKIAFDLPNHE
jgi:hypothetical protein